MFTVGQKVKCVDNTTLAGRALVMNRTYTVREVSPSGIRVNDDHTGRIIPHQYDVARFVALEQVAPQPAATDAPAVTDAPAATDAPAVTDAPAATDAADQKKEAGAFAEALTLALTNFEQRGKERSLQHALRSAAHILEGVAGLLRVVASK